MQYIAAAVGILFVTIGLWAKQSGWIWAKSGQIIKKSENPKLFNVRVYGFIIVGSILLLMSTTKFLAPNQ